MRAEVVNVTWPLPSTFCAACSSLASEHAVPPVLKDTWPVDTAVAGLPDVTVAVKVTASPDAEGFCAEVTWVVVATVAACTTSVPLVVGLPMPWQLLPLVAWTVNGYVPGGVEAVVLIVKVLEKLALVEVVVVGLSLNDAAAPAGSAVVTTRVTVHAVAFPPIVTFAVYKALLP